MKKNIGIEVEVKDQIKTNPTEVVKSDTSKVSNLENQKEKSELTKKVSEKKENKKPENLKK